jgi:ribosomal protein S12 methylthiotransferase accessory factor
MPLRFYDEVLDAATQLRDGTHRAATLEATWRRFAPAARRAGITRIADLTGLDTIGIPVFAAIRPMGKSLSTQQGKGITADAARISALMESLETYSAENLTAKVVRGSFRALRKRHNVVDVRALPRPRGRLDLDANWAWLEGFDLVAGEPILVPQQSITLDTTFTRPPVFDISSNGLASGNVRVEAIVHGLCEVIVRDAEAHWRLQRGQRRVDLDTVADPHCRALLDRIAAGRVRTTVWDFTSDVGVPAYGCAIMEDPREPAWRALGLYQGFGCHLDAPVALARALSEAVQTRVSYISGSRDDFFPHDYARTTDEPLLRQIWDELDRPPAKRVDFARAPRLATATFEADVRLLLDRLRAVGSKQVLVVDLSRPELRIPVVKVLVPGRATRLDLMG